MRFISLVSMFILACGPQQGAQDNSDSPDGEAHKDTESGSVVYVPDNREDVAVGGAAPVANETTGAYLSVPGVVEANGPSINISASSKVEDIVAQTWTVEIPLTKTPSAGEYPALFYHVEREDSSTYYGVLTGDSITVAGNLIRAKLKGLGNYQPGLIETDIEPAEINTTDEILKSSEAAAYTNLIAQHGGKLYAGMERNYALVSDDDGETFTSLSKSVPSIIVKDLHTDLDERLILATGLGVAISDDFGSSFTNINMEAGMPAHSVQAITSTPDYVYAATAAGLSEISGDTVRKVYTTASGLPSDTVQALAYDSVNELLYVGTTKGVAVFDPATGEVGETFDSSNQGLADDSITALAVDQDQRLLVGTAKGLSYKTFSAPTFQTLGIAFGFESLDVRDVYVDGTTIFVATAKKLSTFSFDGSGSPSAPENFGEEQGLVDVRVLGVTAAENKIYSTHRTGASISKDGGGQFSELNLD